MCAFHKSLTSFSISSGLFPRESPSEIPFRTRRRSMAKSSNSSSRTSSCGATR
uniref:Uncharacterized protein n=1 Tax=Arundo donax TaxID=35708 RepID=A0A0A9HKA9_ARUDO